MKKEDPESLVSSTFHPEATQKKKKHAVWIIHGYPPVLNAGAEGMSHCLNKFLLKHGWTVTVILPNFPHKEFEGVHVVPFSDKKKIEKVLEEASILISHLRYSELAASTAAQIHLPLVLLIHNSFQIPYIRDILKVTKDVHLLYNSEWIRDFYKPFHLDNQFLYPPVAVLDFKTDRKYVALINCNKDKGGEILIRLAKAMPETQFLGVIGSYGEQVVEKGIPNLHYMKNTPNIRSFYSKIGIVIMPSVYESWGRVAVEAMSLGIPVVANPTPGLRESLYSVGLFAKDDDLGQWIRAIQSLQTNPWLYELKSQEGHIRAKELAAENKKQLIDVEKWLVSIQFQ